MKSSTTDFARKDGDRVRLYSHPGNDFTRRFPLIAEALTGLRSRSCIIDGEAVACDDNGIPCSDRCPAVRRAGALADGIGLTRIVLRLCASALNAIIAARTAPQEIACKHEKW